MNITSRIMKQWRESLDIQNKIKLLLDGGNFIFFFKNKGILYGTGEHGRVMFAKMKDPNDEDQGWRDDANFTATNLFDLLAGKENQTIFSGKDIDNIQVITDKKEVEDLCAKFAKEIK